MKKKNENEKWKKKPEVNENVCWETSNKQKKKFLTLEETFFCVNIKKKKDKQQVGKKKERKNVRLKTPERKRKT